MTKKLCGSTSDEIDELMLTEAFDYLKSILSILEAELGTMHPSVGECLETLGLIEIIKGHNQAAEEYLQKAYDILNNSAGKFDKRTEDVQDIIKMVICK